jgi:DNA-binding transcriptional LysR family regulator
MEGVLILALVAEHGSFSAAARELGVAPSAVSKRIAALEARLDVRLLLRTTRRVTLSHDGVSVHAHAASVLKAWRALNQVGAEAGGKIRINAPGLFSEVVLAPFLAEFRARRPDILCFASSEDRMIELANGAFDVIIRISRKMTQASAIVRTLTHDRLITVASPEYLTRFGVPKRPADLAAHRCMRYTPREASDEWRFSVAGRPVSTPVQPVFAAADDAALRAAALAGMGLTVMPRMFLAPDLAEGRLVSVLEAEMWSPERIVHAVIVEGRLAPPQVREFVGALARWLRKARTQ